MSTHNICFKHNMKNIEIFLSEFFSVFGGKIVSIFE